MDYPSSASRKRYKQSREKGGLNSRQTKKVQKVFSFTNIKILHLIKTTLAGLPSSQEYKLQLEPEYNRRMAKVLPLLASTRLEQIPYLVSCETFKKILVQLTKQTSNKEIAISLLKELTKGFSQYIELVQKDLYEILSFMVEMEYLGQKIASKISHTVDSVDSRVLQGYVLSVAVFELARNIAKWYGCSPYGRETALKYGKLLCEWK